MPRSLAPIAVFAYNRPDHLAQTLQSLQKNNLAKESELFVFCDGAKNEQELSKINQVREIAQNISGFKKVEIIKSDSNKGLANSIISGVSKIVAQCQKIIVLEDDMVVSPYFLQYMNDGLDFYQDDERVISIHGYLYPIKRREVETFFLRGADCWGWATWQRGWQLFNPNGSELLEQLQKQKLEKKFDFDYSYPYVQMLKDQIARRNNSWAIRWHASAFLANKFTLYPKQTLVKNIGFDGSGVHCGSSDEYDQEVWQEQIFVTKIAVEENKKAYQAIRKFFKPKKFFLIKIFGKIKRKIEKNRLKKQQNLLNQ